MDFEKTNRPPSDPFRQQKLTSWQPVMTPLKVIIIFIAIGIAFIPTGTTLLAVSNGIYEDKIKYDGSGQDIDCSIYKQNQNRQCQMTFKFDEDVDGPIYLYYELENFYQNHRKYVNSRDPSQLQGQQLGESALDLTCQTEIKNNESQILNPCGLIANSFFTDVISVNTESTSADPGGVVMKEDDIAWPSDKDKFIQVEGFKSYKWPDGVMAVTCAAAGLPSDCRTYTDSAGQSWSFYYPSEEKHQYLYESYPMISPIKGVTDQHFMVWMRTAALPNFRKLYGVIHQDFRKNDELILDISANFEVDSFSGSKSIVIAQVGEFGGKNAYLGIAYVVVGCISLMFALLFVTKQIISPRSVADPSLLNWQ